MKESVTNLEASVGQLENGTELYAYGESLANSGRYLEALVSFEQVLALQPKHHAAWVFRGVMLLHLDRYSEALESCDRALAISPVNSEAWLFRGVALHRLGHYQEAYASYDRAVGKGTESFFEKVTRGVRWIWDVCNWKHLST
ncbi:MAG: hypothetical protein Kow00121_28720 [Elainellaceae cyanobacterium]